LNGRRSSKSVLQARKAMACAVYETAPTSLEWKKKKHDTRLLIGRIAFLTCGKSDTQHLIGLHRFANENLLCGFSVCKSQYVYNKRHNFIIDPRIMSYCVSQAILRLEHCKQYTYSICNLSNLSHSNKDQGGIYWSILCLLVPEQRKHWEKQGARLKL